LTNIEKLKLTIQICNGLKFVHANGIIHRDIKPSNIYLDDRNNPVIGDFGLSYTESNETRHTQTQEAVGARLFMAPELEDGFLEEIKPTLDICSLGKLIYWFFSKQVFAREKHKMPNYDLSQICDNPEFHEINSILDKMITENPDDRYQSIEEVLSDLDGLLESLQANAHIIDHNAPQPCMYCAKGNYKMVVKSTDDKQGFTAVRIFGFQAVGSPKWNIFVCDYCGNVQIFRPEYAKNPLIWEGVKLK